MDELLKKATDTAVKYEPNEPAWNRCEVVFTDLGHPLRLHYTDDHAQVIKQHRIPLPAQPVTKMTSRTVFNPARPSTAPLNPAWLFGSGEITQTEPGGVTLYAPGYEKLADVLQRAFEQSSGGKGKERHATGLPFHMQPIVTGAHSYGVGGPLFQVGKKSREAFGMVQRGQTNAAVHELLGAIVYAAGAIVAIEQDKPE